jgi:hypothetical protein
MDSLAHALREVVQTTVMVCDDCEGSAMCSCSHADCKRRVDGRSMMLCLSCAVDHHLRKSSVSCDLMCGHLERHICRSGII